MIINQPINFIRRKVRDHFKETLSKSDRNDLRDKEFVIISNNCWGGEVYQWYARPYNSPFIGVLLNGSCYYKLLSNFDYYINQKLEFIEKSKYEEPQKPRTYPIAKLDDIEVHFVHYDSKEIALEKWERRTERMLKFTDKNNYYFKICEDTGNDKFIEAFHKLPYKNKISFSREKNNSLTEVNHVKIKQKNRDGSFVNGKKLYKLTFLYFDLHQWLKS
jgi:uncharacterized protein (DUF1919 family)